MCLGIPLRIVEIKGQDGIGESEGMKTKVRLDLLKDLKIGDYVMVHAGFAIEKMNEEAAKETLNTLEEIKKVL